MMRSAKDYRRYSAKLLFEFHVVVDGGSATRRLCEERILVIDAASGREALTKAKRAGRAGQYRYRNSNGQPVHFRFVGVQDLLHLGPECEDNEVWYAITQRVRPFERRAKVLPREQDLSAIKEDPGAPRQRQAKRR